MASRITTAQASVASWTTMSMAIFILLLRFLCGRYYQKSNFDFTAVVILLSLAVLVARIIVAHFVLSYGTADDLLLGGDVDLTGIDLEMIKKGTILSLISRLLITTLYWLQCALLLLFYRRILGHIYQVKMGIRLTWVVIGTTYVAVVIATFLECRPFRLYWQIQPDPGQCVRAYVQLFVQCISNIIIDLLLLAISYPILKTQGHDWSRKAQIAGMYTLGSFCIILTCIRVAFIHGSNSAQPARSFWASIQGVVSTFVANAPSIYGQLKLKHRKHSQNTSSRRKTTQPDTYVLMDEMTRRGSRMRGDDVEDLRSNPTSGSDSFSKVKPEENLSWVSETEITHPVGGK